MSKIYISLLAVLSVIVGSYGQTNTDDFLVLSYTNVIEMAQQQSPIALSRKTEKENKYWQYQSFNSSFKPQLVLDAGLPGITKSNELVPQPDGGKRPQNVFLSDSYAGLTASQLFGLTGSRIYINSDLNTSYNFLDSTANFTTTPFEIGLIQPIFKYNPHRWNQKIEKLKFAESEKKFFFDMEQISISATQRFFDLMTAQIERDIAHLNLQNNDTIYKIASGRYNVGQIAENEYLQIELQYLKSQQELEQAELDIKNSSLAIKNYLGIKDDRDVILLLPEMIHSVAIDPNLALEKAKAHRPEMISYNRQLLQAEANLREAELNSGLNADLRMSYGLTTRSNEIENIYDNFGEKQSLNVGLTIPIVDWGRAKSAKNQARANKELVEYDIDQQLVNFDQEVLTHVNYFKQTSKQVELAKKATTVADKRFQVAKNRYMIGNISITDINIATQEKDQSKKNYINALKNYWVAFYQLRKLTMYDFLFNAEIIPAEDESN